MGELVANDSESYRYLAESIRMHPDQETLKGMMEDAGFEQTTYYNLTGELLPYTVVISFKGPLCQLMYLSQER